MSRTGRIRSFFGDQEYDFFLNAGALMELEEALDIGVGAIYALSQPGPGMPFGQVRLRHVRLVIRLALIGGGMDKMAAAQMVERHVVPPDLGDCALLARSICGAAIVGVEEKRQGEPEGEAASPSPTAASTGLPSTEPPAPRASPPAKSAPPASGKSPSSSRATAKRTA